MKYAFLALIVALLASCSMDSANDRPYRTDRDIYQSSNDRYNRSYRTRSGAYESTRERILSGEYQQAPQQQSGYQAPTQTVQETKKEPEKKAWVDPNRDIAKRYPIKNVSYQQIEEMIRGQLSPTGGLSYIKQFHSIYGN